MPNIASILKKNKKNVYSQCRKKIYNNLELIILSMEVWKDIDERYEVSNFGRVKRKNRTIIRSDGKRVTLKERLLKPQEISDGYYAVYLPNDKKQVWKYVHRLVAEAFLPNPDNLPQVNHKDEDKHNNVVVINDDGSIDLEKSNLEWCTVHYNMTYGTKISRGLDTAIKNGHYNDYRGMTIAEKKNEKKKMERERHLSNYKAEKRGRYENLSNLSKEEKAERKRAMARERYKETYVPKKHPVYLYELVPHLVSKFDSPSEAAEYLDIDVHNIYSNVNGKTRSIKTDKGLFIIKKDNTNNACN